MQRAANCTTPAPISARRRVWPREAMPRIAALRSGQVRQPAAL